MSNQIPSYNDLTDAQFIQLIGPDGITTGYQYDQQQRALYFKESQVIYPNFHGITHIAEDPIPNASCDTPGLMSSDDKCKLDALIGTRLGVLGFQGAGFPDDGGWLQGDIILAAGTDFISLERIGNVVRFTVDSPIPLSCGTEETQQIFWVQDETEISSIRPPSASGKLPGINAYGEMKIFLYPESTITDPNDIRSTIQNKGVYPALIFKRYDDSIIPGAAEHELILKRDLNNALQTEIGWAFTPGAAGVPEMVWFMGKDDDGSQITFELDAETEPGLLGSLMFNGHLITKKMGVITDYTSTIINTNQYTVRQWDLNTNRALGDRFTATNVWQYLNPENPQAGNNPQQLITDNTIDILPIGTLVDLWAFKISEIAGEPIYKWFFSKKPTLNPQHLWSWVGTQQFGDVVTARSELPPDPGSEDIDASEFLSTIRDIERTQWGLTGFDDPLFSYDIATTAGTEEAELNTQHRASIDTNLPGLRIQNSITSVDDFSERPVRLWHRQNLYNSIFRIDLGRPDQSTPLDVILRSPIDSYDNKYMQVIEKGVLNGLHYIQVCGLHFSDLPQQGTLRALNMPYENQIFNYTRKFMFPTDPNSTNPMALCATITLTAPDEQNQPYVGQVGDILELVHQEYNSNVVRIEFQYSSVTQTTQLQFKVGTLDMGEPYENDNVDIDTDDYIRGLAPGYTVSAVYTQSGLYTGIGTQPSSTPSEFVVFEGGQQVGGIQQEYWNRLEIMTRDDQVWIWWNQLLIPPNAARSAALPTPVNINTPYFPITVDPNNQHGKYGLRMWPGTNIRRVDLRTQSTVQNEFTYRQLEIV